MWPELNQAHFKNISSRNVLLARDVKIFLGFSTDALKTATEI